VTSVKGDDVLKDELGLRCRGVTQVTEDLYTELVRPIEKNPTYIED
jgi:hypothetical protein